MGLAKNLDIYVYATKKGKMDMDELIFEMDQPNEILTSPEWTEWWVVDDDGLHLEYAPGYEPNEDYNSDTYGDVMDDEISHTDAKTSKSIVIHVDEMYEERADYIHDRWEEVFGKLNYKKENLGVDESESGERYEPTYYPYPITCAADNPEYLDYLREAIDEYNSWYTVKEPELQEELEDPEESVVDLPNSDGLILPTARL